ncbi:endo-1,4-beta-xylanase [Foetidibacter luteolus]|uniref:endo-1,4-beta-xylanase n=1 Tax=Foetidibacter luteolus TaxID=2608880 RepID=UPI00129A8B45|nr:endo-1,4-beta-xylanase [Foetidibacter luteolus]
MKKVLIVGLFASASAAAAYIGLKKNNTSPIPEPMAIQASNAATTAAGTENDTLPLNDTISSPKQKTNEDKDAATDKKTILGAGRKPQGNKTLREAYSDYFPIGAAVNPEYDLANSASADFIKTQFSSLTARMAMQPMRIQPKEGVFNWKLGDQVVNFAQQNNMKVRGHCLVYYLDKHMPAWFYVDENKNLVSRDVLLQRMKTHITQTMQHFKGKVYCWDVVNEAISRKPGEFFRPEGDLFYKIIGEDYVEKAFQFAHEADPTAKLFYNDQFDSEEHRDNVFKFLKKLKQKGVPIDGIGIQSHLGIDGVEAAELQKNIDLFSSIGLELQITELDMSIYKRPFRGIKSLTKEDYTPDIENKQSKNYKSIFDICRKNKGKVTGITFWGYADVDGYGSMSQKMGLKNYPFLFDKGFKPKKAFYEVTKF